MHCPVSVPRQLGRGDVGEYLQTYLSLSVPVSNRSYFVLILQSTLLIY
jgi:hypothetical protein